jgi:hypothetical protein
MGIWSMARIDAEDASRKEFGTLSRWTPWKPWYAWYPVIRYDKGRPWRPLSWRWLWLQQCAWREVRPEYCVYAPDYECHYVPWHIAVAHILTGEEYTCLND